MSFMTFARDSSLVHWSADSQNPKVVPQRAYQCHPSYACLLRPRKELAVDQLPGDVRLASGGAALFVLTNADSAISERVVI
jgi:hypothetical protein